MTTDNFTELKRLFEEECARVKKDNQTVQTINRIKSYPPASFVFAALLSGLPIATAKEIIIYADVLIETGSVDERKVNALAFYPFPLPND